MIYLKRLTTYYELKKKKIFYSLLETKILKIMKTPFNYLFLFYFSLFLSLSVYSQSYNSLEKSTELCNLLGGEHVENSQEVDEALRFKG